MSAPTQMETSRGEIEDLLEKRNREQTRCPDISTVSVGELQ